MKLGTTQTEDEPSFPKHFKVVSFFKKKTNKTQKREATTKYFYRMF